MEENHRYGTLRAQVFFVGSDAKIDMRPSSVWLREKTAKWPWATHLRVGAKRDEALEILSSEGTLLVLCSLVDNMPYVVAEAAVRLGRGVPCCRCMHHRLLCHMPSFSGRPKTASTTSLLLHLLGCAAKGLGSCHGEL
jgi:hypothetical protein